MKRLISILFLSLLFLVLNAWAADQTVNLAGTWILDGQKSDPFPHPLQNLGAPQMGGSQGNLEGGGGGGGRGGTLSGGDMGGGMPGGGMGGGMPRGGTRGPGMGTVPAQTPPMIIEQNETQLKISRTGMVQGKPTPVFETYLLDGEEHAQTTQIPGSPDPIKVVTSTKLKKNSLQVHITTYGPKNKGEMKREFSLSKDGKTLTVNSTNSTPTGDWVQRQVYHKQE